MFLLLCGGFLLFFIVVVACSITRSNTTCLMLYLQLQSLGQLH
jgi:hypothetical protein